MEAVDLHTMEERLEWYDLIIPFFDCSNLILSKFCRSTTWQGKYFNFLGYFFSIYCMWKIFIVRGFLASYIKRLNNANAFLLFFQSTINIVFDRVGRVDPVTRGLEIAVHWIGLSIDVNFWSQHVSFLLVGCIVVTSIRGLLLTLTKASSIQHFQHRSLIKTATFFLLCSSSTQSPVANLLI